MLAADLSSKEKVTLALFKVLSGSVRFRILVLLRAHPNGVSVGEIAEILDGSVSRISHQLSILKKMRLVTGTGTDHQVRYALNDKKIESLIDSLCSANKAMRHGGGRKRRTARMNGPSFVWTVEPNGCVSSRLPFQLAVFIYMNYHMIECTCYHMSLTAEILQTLRDFVSRDSIAAAHATIRAAGGITRYRIIVLLNKYPAGLTATDLSAIFLASPSKISHQIQILKKHNLIVGHKRGPMVVYRLDERNARRFL